MTHARDTETRVGMSARQPFSRRSMLHGGTAAIAGMTLPRSMTAQTPGAEMAPKTLSGTVIASIPEDPQSFQPNFQLDRYLFPIACNIYNTLFMLDHDFNVIPDLATGHEFSEDGRTITVTLNPLATWHDGTPVTAADVKYTLEQIVGDPASPAASLISALDSVDTPEETVAVLNLSRPSASIIGFLSWYGVFILPAHIYEGTDWTTNEANQAPIGSGPFRFVSYEAGASVELEANTAYFGEGPYLERLIYSIQPDPNTAMQALANGEIDYIEGIPTALISSFEDNQDLKLTGRTYPSPIYFGFNMANAPLDNLEVRRAIGMAIDREQIVETALSGYGVPENRYYPSTIEWASNPDATAPDLDIDGANALLDSVNEPQDGDHRFTLRLVHIGGTSEVSDTATVLKEQLAAIGLGVELIPLEFAAAIEQMDAGDFDIGLLDGFQGPDPANLAVRWGTGTTVNYWGYSNPEFDQLLIDGDAGTSPEDRAPAYFAAQELLATEIPGITLVQQVTYGAVTQRLTGTWLDSDDPASPRVGWNRFTFARLTE